MPQSPDGTESRRLTPAEIDDTAAAMARAEGEQRAMAYVAQVQDLCELAGQPALAAQYIERRVDVEHVRAALLDARAAVTDAEPISAYHGGRRSPDQVAADGWRRAVQSATAGQVAPQGGFSPAGARNAS
jgi:hypothetical protein